METPTYSQMTYSQKLNHLRTELTALKSRNAPAKEIQDAEDFLHHYETKYDDLGWV